MSRRKGEAKLTPAQWHWAVGIPMERAINGGSHWFDAWVQQCCTPLARLAKVTGIDRDRLHGIRYQGDPTGGEIALLARAWHCRPDDVIASIDTWSALQKGPTCSASQEATSGASA